MTIRRLACAAAGLALVAVLASCSNDEQADSTTTTTRSDQTTTTTLPERLQRELDQQVGLALTMVQPGAAELTWQAGVNGPRTSNVFVSSDGLFAYVVGGEETPAIAAFTTADGTPVWRGTPDPASIALDLMYADADRVVGWYAKSDDESYLAAYDPSTGIELWQRLLTSDTEPRAELQCRWPTTAETLVVFVGLSDGNPYQLIALDPETGLSRWSQSGISSPCAVLSNGIVMGFGFDQVTGLPALIGLDEDTGEIRWDLDVTATDFDSSTAQILDTSCGDYVYLTDGFDGIIPVKASNGELGGSRPIFARPTVDAAAAERTTLACVGDDVLLSTGSSLTRRSADLGTIRWTLDATSLGTALPNPTIAIVNDAIVVSDSSGAARVIDAASGVVRWGYEVGSIPLVTPFAFNANAVVSAQADPTTGAINGLLGRDAPSGATAWTMPIEALGMWGLTPLADGRVLALLEIPPGSGGGGGGGVL